MLFRSVRPLSLQFAAWQQVISQTDGVNEATAAALFPAATPDAQAEGLDDLMNDLLDSGLAVGPTNANIGLGGTTTFAAEVNDTISGKLGAADLDWSAIAVAQGHGQFVGTGDTHTIFPLRENVGRYLITDINNPSGNAAADSAVVIMFDQTSVSPAGFNHVPGGANLLYLDGHVSFGLYDPDAADQKGRTVLATESVWVTAILQNFVGSAIAGDTNPDCQ